MFDDLEILASEYYLGLANNDDLVAAAHNLLNAEIVSQPIVDLAHTETTDDKGVRAGWTKLCDCHGVSQPSDNKAAGWVLLRGACKKVSDGRLDPIKGLSEIMRIYRLVQDVAPGKYVGSDYDICNFVGWYYEYDDYPELFGAGFRVEMQSEAAAWLAKHSPETEGGPGVG